MKREKVFNANGFYSFVLESNLMLHKHVAACGQQLLSTWLLSNSVGDPIRVLDLACGGSPVSISMMLKSCPQRKFHYTGVDINPDQIEAARKFQFSNNVVEVKLIEGNAWDLSSLTLGDEYDIVFTGMNLHHGNPEEIYCLLLQIKARLSSQGVFVNHDFYRPHELPYLRRPQVNPRDPCESFVMISDETLSKFNAKVFGHLDSGAEVDWRVKFMERYIEVLEEKGAPEQGIREVVSHVMSRDFPISVLQMREIAGKAGFDLSVLDLKAGNEPLSEFFALVTATPKTGSP